MKRGILYLAVLSIMLLQPVRRTDLGKLKPVETVLLYEEDGLVVLITDTEDWGRGATPAEALRNMKEASSGIIYMDTADYLLVEEGAESWISDMDEMLKGNVKICKVAGGVDLQLAATYLRIHTPDLTLKAWNPFVRVPVLVSRNGQLALK